MPGILSHHCGTAPLLGGKGSGNTALCDLLFLVLLTLYTILVWLGIQPMSGMGAVLDSDLGTYAQGMAAEAWPGLFATDAALATASEASGIPNLERLVGGWLAPDGNFALGLLRAGALAIFVFYSGWYILGRWLCKSPALAASLSLLMGLTIWIGWGTFWGVAHSDPIPRVFFAAIFPFILLLAMKAVEQAALRPLAMLAAGCAMWVHGISALNCGAMIFMAFLCLKPENWRLSLHVFNLFFCLFAFFTPVLIFLWPSLSQSQKFSPGDMALFQEFFELRWHEDYSGFGERMLRFLNPFSFLGLLCGCALAGWLTSRARGNAREKIFCRMLPPCLAALGLVAAFCWLEGRLAPGMGRLPMGHELVRGLRFLVPLAWICVVCGAGCLLGRFQRRLALLIVAAILLTFTVDRQYMAAHFALARLTGIQTPLAKTALKVAEAAENYRAMLEAVKKIVPPGEPVYSPGDDMALRYYAKRPISHAFKDGYIFFYNKDLAGARRWLHLEKLARSGPDGPFLAWRESGAPWYLAREDSTDEARLAKYGSVRARINGWLLAREN